MKDGVDIASRGTSACVEIESENDSSSCSLEIAVSQSCDAGRYSVIARNCHGVVKASVRVDVEEEANRSVNEEMAVIVPIIYDSTEESVCGIIPMKEAGFGLNKDSKETTASLQPARVNFTMDKSIKEEKILDENISVILETENIESKENETDQKNENLQKSNKNVADKLGNESEIEYCIHSAIDVSSEDEKIRSGINTTGDVRLTETDLKPEAIILVENATNVDENVRKLDLTVKDVTSEEIQAKEPEFKVIEVIDLPDSVVLLTDSKTMDHAVIKAAVSEEIHTKESELKVSAVVDLTETAIKPDISIMQQEISTSKTEKGGEVIFEGDISIVSDKFEVDAEVKKDVGLKENERPSKTVTIKDHLTDSETTDQAVIKEDTSEEIQTKESKLQVSAVINLMENTIEPETIIVKEIPTSETDKQGKVKFVGDFSIMEDMYGQNAEVKEGVGLKENERPLEMVKLLTELKTVEQAAIKDDTSEEIQTKKSGLKVSAVIDLSQTVKPDIIIVQDISTNESERDGEVILDCGISIVADNFGVDADVKDGVRLKAYESLPETVVLLTNSEIAMINEDFSKDVQTKGSELQVSAVADLTEKATEPEIIIVKKMSTNETENEGKAIIKDNINIQVDTNVKEDVGLKENKGPSSTSDTGVLLTDSETIDQAVIRAYSSEEIQTKEIKLKVSAIIDLTEKTNEPDSIIVQETSTDETEKDGEVILEGDISIVEDKFGVDAEVRKDIGLKENERPSEMIVPLTYMEIIEQAVVKVDISEEMPARESELKSIAVVEVTEKATEPEILIVKEISTSETERDREVILEGDISIVGDKFGVVAEVKGGERLIADEVAKLKFETLTQFEGDEFEEASLMGQTSATSNNIEFALVENFDTMNAVIAKLISPENEFSSFCQLGSDDLELQDEANDELMAIEKVKLTSVYARALTADEMPSLVLLSTIDQALVSESLPLTDGVDFQMKDDMPTIGRLDGISGSDSNRENFSETDLAQEILKINLKSISTNISGDDVKTTEPDICEVDTVQKLQKVPVEDDKPLCEISTTMKHSADGMIQDDAFTGADGLAYSG